MWKRKHAALLLMLAVVWTSVSVQDASAQLIVGRENENDIVYHLDVTSGVYTALFTPIDNGIDFAGIEGLTVDDAGRTIYFSTGVGSPTMEVLYSAHYDDLDPLNPGLLRVRKVADLQYQSDHLRLTGLAWDSDANRLLGSYQFGVGPEGIYEINTSTGDMTLLLDMDAEGADIELSGLDYNPSDGLLYATNLDYGNRYLNSIDLVTGTRTVLASSALSGSTEEGLAISNDNKAYIVSGYTGNDIHVFNITTDAFEADLTAPPWAGSNATSAGAGWGPSALTAPAGPNLAIILSADVADGQDVELGSSIVYTVTLANVGDDASSGADYTISLGGAATATITNISGAGTPVEGPAGTVTGSFATFIADRIETVEITISTTGEGELTLDADFSITAGTPDIYLGNNTGSHSNNVRVYPAVDTVFFANLSAEGGASSEVPGLPGVYFKPPSGATSNAFYRPARSPDGRYIAFMAIVDTGSSSTDNVMMLGDNGVFDVIAQEGVTEVTTGELFGSMILEEDVSLNNLGQLAMANDTNASSSSDETILRYDGAGAFTVIAREDDIIPAFAAEGWDYEMSMDSANINGVGDVAFRVDDLGGAPSAEDEALLGANGTVVIAQAGDVPAGQAGGGTLGWDYFDAEKFWTDAMGANWLVQGDLTGSSGDDILVVDGRVVLQEGQGVPGLTGTIPSPSTSAGIIFPRMMSNGDWFCRGTTSDADQDFLVKGYGPTFSVLAKHGDEIYPGAGEHWADDEGWSRTFLSVSSNNQGDYIICGRTDNPMMNRNTVAVLNGTEVVLREGDAVDLDNNGSFDDGLWIRFFEESDALLTDSGDFYAHVNYTDASSPAGSGSVIGKALLRLSVNVSEIPTGADIVVTKSADTDLVTTVGDQITYTVTVCNAGLEDATNVVMTDTLPAEVEFVSATNGAAETFPGSGVVTATIAGIPAFACETFEIVVDTLAEGDAVNVASATADQDDPNPANNSASASTTIANHADISVTKVDDGGAPVGVDFTYTITITNNGPAPATNVQMTDNLDPTTVFQSATNGADETFPGSGIVTATFASISNGGSEVVEITVQGSMQGSVTNSVAVSSDEIDVNTDDNSDIVETLIGDVADVTVTKVDEGAAIVGSQFTYTITVSCSGPASATDVFVQDTLPGDVIFISADNGAAETFPGSGIVEVTFASIPNGGQEVIHIVVETTIEGEITNQVTASAAEADPNDLDNTAWAVTRVGYFKIIEVIYSEISGDPTAQVPGAKDLAGLPAETEFVSITDLRVSHDGSDWIVKGTNGLGSSLMNMLLLGSGMTGDMFAQEGQPFQGGIGSELYDFFDSSANPASFDTSGNIGFSCRARGGSSANDEKIVFYDAMTMTHTIVLQEGDLLYGLTDEPPNPSGDEIVGSSVGSVFLRDDGELWLAMTPIGNCSSFRYPAMFVTDTRWRQSRTDMIGGFTWDTFSYSGCGGTPDGSSWYAKGEIEEGATADDEILVVDDVIVIREGSPLDGSALNVDDNIHTKMLSNGDWFSRGDYVGSDDWAVRNGTRIAQTGDSVAGGAELWGVTLTQVVGNRNGDYLVTGNTDIGDVDYDYVMVRNGTEVVIREGDPIDLDGNGMLDDGVFLRTFSADDIFYADSGVVYFLATLRDGEGTTLGDAFLTVDLSEQAGCPTVPGDLDGDPSQLVNGLDLGAFVDCMIAGAPLAGQCPCGDFDDDGDIDADDLDAFVTMLVE